MPTVVPASASEERCALVLASNLTDGAVIVRVLADAGVEVNKLRYSRRTPQRGSTGVGTIIITEEALVGTALDLLAAFFAEQPPWSQVSLILLTAHVHSRSRMPSWRQSVAYLPFVRSATLLERPS